MARNISCFFGISQHLAKDAKKVAVHILKRRGRRFATATGIVSSVVVLITSEVSLIPVCSLSIFENT